MKKLLFIMLLLVASCTFPQKAKTRAECPCTIVQIRYSECCGYNITVSDGSNNSFSFYTTDNHQLGDTIQ